MQINQNIKSKDEKYDRKYNYDYNRVCATYKGRRPISNGS